MTMSVSLPWRQKKKTNKRNDKKQTKSLLARFSVYLPEKGFLAAGALSLAVLLGVGSAWWTLMDPQTLPVKQVLLQAPFVKVSKERLYEVIRPEARGGYFNVDVDAVTAAVEALPWVDKALVRRAWPDALHVTVREQKALARWRDKALVNVRGELFFPPAETFPASLIELRGPRTTVAQMAEQFQLFKRVLQEGEQSMAGITLTPRRAWEIELSNGTVVVLGRSAMALRLQRFVRFYPRLLVPENGVKHVDMRYTNGFAVKWRVPTV